MVTSRRSRSWGAAVAALTVLGACSTTQLSVDALPSGTGTPAVTIPTIPAATPAAPTPAPGVVVDHGTITQDTDRTAWVVSGGEYVVWSSGVRAEPGTNAAPDLFAALPGADVVQLYDNPNRGSQLLPIVGDGSQFAFVEVNRDEFGYGGWMLWYLARPGADPVEIDQGQMDVIPFVALAGKWLVWTPYPGELSQLVAMDLETGDRRTLLSSRIAETQYWYPAVDGDRLVYATIESTADGGDFRHIYLLDLADPGQPRRLDNAPSASEPSIAGDQIVWKESDPTLNFLVSGGLVHLDLGTGIKGPLPLRPGPQPMAGGYPAGFDFPSVGDRFVAAWTDSFDGDRVLYLADLLAPDLLLVDDLGPTSSTTTHDIVVRPSLRGDLLAYNFFAADGEHELRWARVR